MSRRQRRPTRRSLLAAGPAALGTFLLDPRVAQARGDDAEAAPSAPPFSHGYPAQEPAAVREVVSVSHFSLEKVRALVDDRPELAKAAWDWGFGDWETALGAASHTGNHAIAEYLIDNGARPDLFTAAMMGNLAAVRAFVEGTPGIQSLPGPHGIHLRRHAELGGERALAVLEYLDEVGGADRGPEDLPLELDRAAYVGTYEFGRGPEDRFEITLGREDRLMLQRGSGTARALFYQGKQVFNPAGAPSARIHFWTREGVVKALEIHNPAPIVTAKRLAGDPAR